MYLNPSNNCSFIGRLVKDPEYKTVNTKNGAMGAVRFTLAVQRTKDVADFVNFDAVGGEADFINKYFKKGSVMAVTAGYTTRSYEKDGKKMSAHSFDVVKASFVPGTSNGGGQQQSQPQTNNNDFGFGSDYTVNDGDIPF